MSERYAGIGALLEDLYATISGPAGSRKWSRERELFHPLARLMRTGTDGRWIMSVLWDNERDGVRLPEGWRSSNSGLR